MSRQFFAQRCSLSLTSLNACEGSEEKAYLLVRSVTQEVKHCSVTMLYCMRKSRNVFRSVSVVFAAMTGRSYLSVPTTMSKQERKRENL